MHHDKITSSTLVLPGPAFCSSLLFLSCWRAMLPTLERSQNALPAHTTNAGSKTTASDTTHQSFKHSQQEKPGIRCGSFLRH
jgi:hypothetical protein